MCRPSSPDDPDEPPPAARRRLPPEIDVVGLAGGLLAGAVALAGCAASPEEVRSAGAGSKAHVLEVSRDVLGRLAHLGTFTDPTLGSWSGCDDLGGKVLYHVTGRLDPRAGKHQPLSDEVVATLRPAGLRLQPVYPDLDDPVTLEAVRDDVNVQFSGYASRPFVLFDISGLCLDVGDLDGELLGEQGEILTLG